VLAIAKRVLENVALGRVYEANTVEWAERIVSSNPQPSRAPENPTPSRAQEVR
jgi:hypothetical protein